MDFKLRFSEEKNQLLKTTRNISFEEIINALDGDGLLADITHPSRKRANQRIYIIKIGNYAYAVPYVKDPSRQEIFLKTIYPSSRLTKLYLRKGEDDE